MTGADRPSRCMGLEAISGDSSCCHVAVRGRGMGCWPSPDVNERGSDRMAGQQSLRRSLAGVALPFDSAGRRCLDAIRSLPLSSPDVTEGLRDRRGVDGHAEASGLVLSGRSRLSGQSGTDPVIRQADTHPPEPAGIKARRRSPKPSFQNVVRTAPGGTPGEVRGPSRPWTRQALRPGGKSGRGVAPSWVP